jgi:hypothetical protein
MKRLLPILIFFALSTASWASAQAQHPIGYGSLLATSQTGTFSFTNLDRTILKSKTATFFSAEPVNLTFEILISTDGRVKYVRAPRIANDKRELRLACVSALYDFEFSPVSISEGEKWFKVTLVCSAE